MIDYGFCVPIKQILQNDAEDFAVLHRRFSTDDQIMTFSMMFYSEDAGVRPLLRSSSIAGALFGAIHCLAWNFGFPSHFEKIMWRTASLGIVGSCSMTLVGVTIWKPFSFIVRHFLTNWARLIIVAVKASVSLTYSVARITLLVLAVTSLRNLPPSALNTVDWTELVPHI